MILPDVREHKAFSWLALVPEEHFTVLRTVVNYYSKMQGDDGSKARRLGSALDAAVREEHARRFTAETAALDQHVAREKGR